MNEELKDYHASAAEICCVLVLAKQVFVNQRARMANRSNERRGDAKVGAHQKEARDLQQTVECAAYVWRQGRFPEFYVTVFRLAMGHVRLLKPDAALIDNKKHRSLSQCKLKTIVCRK